MTKTIDATFNGWGKYEGKAYFFKDKQYARFDWGKDAFDKGLSPISAWGLKGAFADGVDAALEGRGAFLGKVYFFKRDKYVRFDWATDRLDTEPTPLDAWGLTGAFLKGIDAALNGAGAFEKYAYFFNDDKYVVYNWEADAVEGGIKNLSDWKLPAEMAKGIDAALLGSGSVRGKAYFFKDDKYARYDWAAKRCDAGLDPGPLATWKIPDELVPSATPGPPALRFAWIEYEHPGDGVMLGSGLEALGWKNIFDELGPPGAVKRVVKPTLPARVERVKWGSASTLMCRPTDDADDFLGKWVLNPGVSAGALTYRATPVQADLVCISGHGGNGEVFGKGSMAAFHVTEVTSANVAMATTGKVKYLIIAACSNLMEDMATRWEPILRKANPIHGILGYEKSYAGNEIGAKVMKAFVPLLKANKTILQAWKEANLSVAPKQPWAALVHAESVNNTLADWVEDRLPVPARRGALKHFGKNNPTGKVITIAAKPYTVAYKMANGVVIDGDNNSSSNTAVGLIPGQAGALVVTKAAGSFAMGDEITLLFYHFRADHDGMDLDGLLTFDPAVLATPPPSTATVSVTKLSGANPNAPSKKFDGVKIEVLSAVPSFELPYTVSAKAHSAYEKRDNGTYGYFPIGLYPPGTAPDLLRNGEVEHYTTGAWLR